MKKLIILLFLLNFAKVYSQKADSSFYKSIKRQTSVILRTNESYQPSFSYKQQCSNFGIRINLWTGKIEAKKYYIYREHDKKWRLPIYWSY